MALGTTAFLPTASSLHAGRMTARRLTIMVAAAIFVSLGSGAGAQAPLAPPRPDTSSPVKLTVEQRHVIKELVKDLKVQSVGEDAPAAIGDKVPERIVAQPIPVEVGQKVPQIRLHAFYVKGEDIILVNPKDRTITDVIN